MAGPVLILFPGSELPSEEQVHERLRWLADNEPAPTERRFYLNGTEFENRCCVYEVDPEEEFRRPGAVKGVFFDEHGPYELRIVANNEELWREWKVGGNWDGELTDSDSGGPAERLIERNCSPARLLAQAELNPLPQLIVDDSGAAHAPDPSEAHQDRCGYIHLRGDEGWHQRARELLHERGGMALLIDAGEEPF
jgi:hypothetical protein